MTGVVERMLAGKGFGFIRGSDGNVYFVYATENDQEEFLKLRSDMKVTFTGFPTPKGLRARDVHVVA